MRAGQEFQERTEAPRAGAAPLQLLIDAIDRVQSARTVDELMGIVRRAARRLSGADGVSIVLRDGDQCHYAHEDAISPLWKGQRFPLLSCISGWAMLNRETAVVPDVFADARIPHAAYRPTFVRSLIMVPVGGEEKTAAIGAYWSKVRTPDPWEIAVLDALARSTGAALRNIELVASLSESAARAERLYEQAQQELAERRRAETRSCLLSRELGHRVKNILAVVQSLAMQADRRAHSIESFREAFVGRLQAFARAHDLLLGGQDDAADLRVLVEQALAAYRLDDPGRVEVAGPAVTLTAPQALALGLVLHELGTNAAKYGCLSTPAGRLRVAWQIDPVSPCPSSIGKQRGAAPASPNAEHGETSAAPSSGPASPTFPSTGAQSHTSPSPLMGEGGVGVNVHNRIRLTWHEAGGPPVSPPDETGFGTLLIERACTYELDGTVTLDYAPEGLRCTIAFPVD